jgi:hypothetical protein
MAWFRSNRGGIAWLACFALACQLALTFGHVHRGNSGNFSAASVAAGDVDRSDGRSRPTPETPGLAKDLCAICKSIGMASTLLLPAAPTVIPPISVIRNSRWSPAATGLASHGHFHFNARAPPDADLPA